MQRIEPWPQRTFVVVMTAVLAVVIGFVVVVIQPPAEVKPYESYTGRGTPSEPIQIGDLKDQRVVIEGRATEYRIDSAEGTLVALQKTENGSAEARITGTDVTVTLPRVLNGRPWIVFVYPPVEG